MKKFKTLSGTCIFLLLINIQTFAVPKIIFDTDIAGIDVNGRDISDIDDLGALAILNAWANKQRCEILCVLTNSRSDKVVEMVDAVNTYYGNPGIPVGLKYGVEGLIEDKNGFSKYISEKFASSLKSIDAPSAANLLREVFTKVSETDTVIYIHADGIANFDFLSISSFLESKPDNTGKLEGWELFNQKVDLFVTYIPCLPNDGVSDNCPEWTNVPATDKLKLQFFLDNFENNLIGNTTAVEEAHLPTNLWKQPDSNPVKMAYEYYYTKTPPPWHSSGEIPESISIYGDGLGIFYLIGNKSIGHLFQRKDKGCFVIDGNQKLRWDQERENKNHSYFFTKPELHQELWNTLDQLICFDPQKKE
jgi:hypothetical protein